MLAVAVIGITGISTLGVSLAANAQASSGNTLVDKIAKKFNLNEADVQKVFDENKAEHQAERQQRFERKLDKAVSDGEITLAQKDEILAKLKEMKTFFESLKGRPPAERRAMFVAKKKELQQWAKDNNIPLGLLMPGEHLHGGFGSHRSDFDHDDAHTSLNNQQ